MLRSRFVIVVLGVVAAVCLTYWPYFQTPEDPDAAHISGKELGGATSSSLPVANEKMAAESTSSAPNRSVDVPNGFRGEIHPLLGGKTDLEVVANWTTLEGASRDKLRKSAHPRVYEVYQGIKPAQSRQTYAQRSFSAFLPDNIEAPGQVWTIAPETVAGFLRQLHPEVSMRLVAKGRRAGPDGAFGILRAVSADYLDIVCRVHAEFNLTPKAWLNSPVPLTVWYTPAFFTGRLLVNRQTGTVDYFRLDLPDDRSLNVHLTVFLQPAGEFHEIVRVEHMELSGGDHTLVQKRDWKSAITFSDAQAALAHQFYKFNDISWVSADKALARARETKRPILAIVLWGSLDDQSC